MEQKLRKLLKRVPRYYEDFELGIVLIGRESPETMKLLVDYLEKHPHARTSEIIGYAWSISNHVSEPPEPDEN